MCIMKRCTLITLTLLSVLTGELTTVVSQCPSTDYKIVSSGFETSTPDPVSACQGLPFFPECEDGSLKYFSIESSTDVALFLSPKGQITNAATDLIYQIELQKNGNVRIQKNGEVVSESETEGDILSGSVFLFVSVIMEDGTLHVGRKDGGNIASWKDGNPIDVNYILVQKYNDPDGEDAVFKFCDGVVKLLSKNGESLSDIVAEHIADDGDFPAAVAGNAIDGNANNGIFDENVCQATDDGNTEDFAWWRIDLQEMYEITAVTIFDAFTTSAEYACPKGWRYFGSACYFASTNELSWNDVKTKCEDMDSDLVTIRTKEVWDFLLSWLDKTVDYWIGVNDIDMNTMYTWTAEEKDNIPWGWTDGDPKYYTNWDPGEPKGAGQHCGSIRFPEETWFIRNCGSNSGYICQQSLCPDDFILFGNDCYFVGSLAGEPTAEWYDAETDCVDNRGGHLVTVDNAYEQGFLDDLIGSAPDPWIGLSDTDTEGDFVWTSDSNTVIYRGTASGAALGGAYTDWDSGQPNDVSPGQDCVIVRVGNGWHDNPCSQLRDYICEKTPISPPQGAAGVEVRVGSCDHPDNPPEDVLEVIKLNDACQPPISSSEESADLPGWLLRKCDSNHYGQFVYLLKEDSNNAHFSLCEVEVWGKEIADADKPKIGFTRETVSDLENNLSDNSPLKFYVRKSDGSSAKPTCCKFSLEPMTSISPAAVKDTETGDEDADFNFDFQTTPLSDAESFDFEFNPSNTEDKEFSVTVFDDLCPANDEFFGFKFSHLSKGLIVGDATTSIYPDILFTIENDDVTYCWKDITLSVHENTRTVTAVLTRFGYTDSSSIAYISTSDDDTADANTATAGTDYTIITPSTAIMFGNNIDEVEVPVTILEDQDCEVDEDMDETFKLIVEGTSEGKICKDSDDNELNTVLVTILHDDVMFKFQETNYKISETEKEVEVVVELVNGAVNRDVMIDVKSQPTETSAATPELDYIPSSIDTTLTIVAGLTTASLTVPVIDDNKVEDDTESFQLKLVKNPLSLTDCVLHADSVADIMIEDNDCCWSVEEEQLAVSEGSGSIMITFKCERDDDSIVDISSPVTADLQIDTSSIIGREQATTGTDFSVWTTTVTVEPGTSSETIEAIMINDDIEEEQTEYFEITLISADHGELCGPLTTTVAIEDNDATVKITSCGDEGNVLESGKQVRVTLERSGDISKSDSVLLFTDSISAQPDTGDGNGDYVDTNVVKTFTAQQNNIIHDVIINDDFERENDETFTIEVKKRSQHTYIDTTLDRCTVTIIDDDCTFYISIPESSRMLIEGNGVTVTITVSRVGYLDRAASVYIEASNVNGDTLSDATSGQDYASLSRLVTFGVGDASESVTLFINNDDIPEIVEYLRVSLSNGDCSIDGDDTVVIAIEDDDEVVIRMRDAEITVNEDSAFACPVVYRTGPLGRTDVVTLSVTPTAVSGVSQAATAKSDFDDSPLTVTFEANEDEKRACVAVYNDTFEEQGLESFTVRITGTMHRQIRQASSVLQATIDDDHRETVVYIRDDDGTFQISCPTKRISESVGSVTCYVERTGSTTDTRVVYVSTGNAAATSTSDYEPLSAEALTFQLNMKSMQFTVKIYDDQDVEGSEDFFVYLAADSSGTDLGQRVELITIIDDDNTVKFLPAQDTSATEDTVTVPESIGSVRLTIQRDAYGFALPSGVTSVRISTREISPGDVFGTSPADDDGVDYEEVNTEVTFQIGQTRLDVLVEINDDQVGEPQEAFQVVLSTPSPESNNFIVYPNVMTVYINDDDGGEEPSVGEGDDAGAGADDEGTQLSRAFIIGLGGGLGLLVLIGVLGLVGCVGLSRLSQVPAAAATPRAPPLPGRRPGGVSTYGPPRYVASSGDLPASFYASNPSFQY